MSEIAHPHYMREMLSLPISCVCSTPRAYSVIPYRLSRTARGSSLFFFFFQAEDGIRDLTVTGVQTCALPIFAGAMLGPLATVEADATVDEIVTALTGGTNAVVVADAGKPVGVVTRSDQIGRASCRERG